MPKKDYKFVKMWENWIVHCVITNDVEIDLSKTVKNIRDTRAEFIKAWTYLYEMAKALESHKKNHEEQNKFLSFIKDSIGEDYILPELPEVLNSEEVLKQLNSFKDEETKRREDNLKDFSKKEDRKDK